MVDPRYRPRIIPTPFGPIDLNQLPSTVGLTPSGRPGWTVPTGTPQQPNESNIAFGIRQGMQGAGAALTDAWNTPGAAVAQAFESAGDTPAARERRAALRAERDAAQAAAAPAAQPSPATQPFQPRNMFGGFQTVRGGEPGAPRDGGARRHRGRDYAIPFGTPLVPGQPWEVIQRGQDRRSGRWIRVRLADGSEHSISHLSATTNRDRGGPNEPFARTGASGNATGPSAHVRTWLSGNEIDDPNEYWGAFGSTNRSAQMSQMANEFGAPPPAFNPQPYEDAANWSREAARVAMQPTSVEYTEQPRPERPAPTPFEAPDFTAGNLAFEAARPVDPFADPGERRRIQRQNYFRGMAEALASINWGRGVGLGELFAKMGSGALAGRLHGDDVIRQRQDDFDQAMQRFNLALAQRNDQQAAEAARTANANIEQMNRHNDGLFADAVQEWSRHLTSVRDGVLITHRVGDNGQVRTTFTPIGNAPLVDHYQRMAQIALSRGEAESRRDILEWEATRQDARTALAYTLTNPNATPEQQDQALLLDATNTLSALVGSGNWRELFADPALAESLNQQAAQAAGIDPRMIGAPGFAPTREQDELIRNFLIEKLLTLHLSDPEALRALYSQGAATAARLRAQAQSTRSTTRVDAQGRTTRSTTVSPFE